MEKATQLCQSGELHTVKELREMAKALEIARYSTLPKAKLCKEIASVLKVTIKNVNGNEDIELPNGCMDAITQDVLYDPYVLSDGFSYNKSSIQQLFAGSDRPVGPESKQALDKNVMIPNVNLKKAVLEWLIEVGKETEQDVVEEPTEQKVRYDDANFVNGIYWDDRRAEDETMVEEESEEDDEMDENDAFPWLIRRTTDPRIDQRFLSLVRLIHLQYAVIDNVTDCEVYLMEHPDIRRTLAGNIVLSYAGTSSLREYIIRDRPDQNHHVLSKYHRYTLQMEHDSTVLFRGDQSAVYRAIGQYKQALARSDIELVKVRYLLNDSD